MMVRVDDLLLVSCGLQVIAGCGGLACAATSKIAMSGTVMQVV